MRWSWLLAMTLAAGCAGGQTGEITELTACTDPTEVPLTDAERAELAAVGEPWTGPLTWDEDGAVTEVTVSFVLVAGPAMELVGERCEHPVRVVPIALRLDTADGQLADVLEGTLERPAGAEAAAISASRLVSEVEGTIDPGWTGPLDADARIVAALSNGPGTSTGQLFVAPGGERDQQQLAAW